MNFGLDHTRPEQSAGVDLLSWLLSSSQLEEVRWVVRPVPDRATPPKKSGHGAVFCLIRGNGAVQDPGNGSG